MSRPTTPREALPQLVLRLAVLSCFVAHGYKAIVNSTLFHSEWNTWIQTLFPFEHRYVGAKYFLRTVGVVDVAIGLCFLVPRLPKVALAWAIGWGLATAASRLYFQTNFGTGDVYFIVRPLGEFLIRLPNGLLPLLLVLSIGMWSRSPTWLRPAKVLPLLLDGILGYVLIHYLVELAAPNFLVELAAKGQPLWYFYLGLGIAGCALLLRIAARTGASETVAAASAVAGLAAFLLPEAFRVYLLFTRNGSFYGFLHLAEKLPVYAALFGAVTLLAPGAAGWGGVRARVRSAPAAG